MVRFIYIQGGEGVLPLDLVDGQHQPRPVAEQRQEALVHVGHLVPQILDFVPPARVVGHVPPREEPPPL